MAVGDLVTVDGWEGVGLQLDNRTRPTIARITAREGVIGGYKPTSPVTVVAAAGSPRARAAAALVRDPNAPYSGNTKAALRANPRPAGQIDVYAEDGALGDALGRTPAARGTLTRGPESASSSDPARLTAAERRSEAARARIAGTPGAAGTGNS